MIIKFSKNDNVDGCNNCADRMDIYDKDGKHLGGERVLPLYECPEDAIIGRDLISCATIIRYMRLAYESGKKGEEFKVEDEEWD